MSVFEAILIFCCSKLTVVDPQQAAHGLRPSAACSSWGGFYQHLSWDHMGVRDSCPQTAVLHLPSSILLQHVVLYFHVFLCILMYLIVF